MEGKFPGGVLQRGDDTPRTPRFAPSLWSSVRTLVPRAEAQRQGERDRTESRGRAGQQRPLVPSRGRVCPTCWSLPGSRGARPAARLRGRQMASLPPPRDGVRGPSPLALSQAWVVRAFVGVQMRQAKRQSGRWGGGAWGRRERPPCLRVPAQRAGWLGSAGISLPCRRAGAA